MRSAAQHHFIQATGFAGSLDDVEVHPTGGVIGAIDQHDLQDAEPDYVVALGQDARHDDWDVSGRVSVKKAK